MSGLRSEAFSLQNAGIDLMNAKLSVNELKETYCRGIFRRPYLEQIIESLERSINSANEKTVKVANELRDADRGHGMNVLAVSDYLEDARKHLRKALREVREAHPENEEELTETLFDAAECILKAEHEAILKTEGMGPVWRYGPMTRDRR